MEWYWWALIALGVAAFVFIKVKVSGSFMKSMKKRQDEKMKYMEEDE
jgi:hypothetical protein